MTKDKKDTVVISIDEYQDLVNKQVALKSEISEVRSSISYRLGNTLLISLRSWRGILSLPKSLYTIYKDARAKQNLRLVHGYKLFGAPVREPLSTPKNNVSDKDISKVQDVFNGKLDGGKVRVAAIMDEFTQSSFIPECKLLSLTPDKCIDELNEFKPDLLFIESAWKGKDKAWERKVSTCTEEVTACIDWCYQNNVPTLLWNKEDPVHYNSFLPLARFVDYVFTTDFDSIPKYKSALGHNRVYLLPFAAQPKYHNPIEKHERKDAFNFAGSYYVRFPERTLDFKKLIAVADSYKGVDIFDRNYNAPHPHFTFPEEYKDKILGGLPFSEIDKAYKGYKFGININTIKQSQSMFARRVFELVGSNTVVISNFSRGVRSFFGDLVVTSDDSRYLQSSLQKYTSDELSYKKYRLMGLRKVMSEHTYAHRLDYIVAKLSGREYKLQDKKITIFGVVANEGELNSILENFQRQTHRSKALYILLTHKHGNAGQTLPPEVQFSTNELEFKELFDSLSQNDIYAFFNASDYYGKSYLQDMCLAFSYSDANVITKSSYFEYQSNKFVQNNIGDEYKFVRTANPFRSIFRKSQASRYDLLELCSGSDVLEFTDAKILSIDCLNYCHHTNAVYQDINYQPVMDLTIADTGVTCLNYFEDIKFSSMAESGIRSGSGSIVTLNASILKEVIPDGCDDVNIKVENQLLRITSNMSSEEDEEKSFLFNKYFTRDELNLLSNNQFVFDIASTFNGAASVFEFYDYNKNLIDCQSNQIDGTHYSLNIPPLCTFVRLGFKCQGTGLLSIKQVIIGQLFEIPAVVVGKTDTLVLTNQYPSYENLYRFGFLHSRVKGYKELGVNVDVFRLTNEGTVPFREFEGVDVAQGDGELLERTLASGQYKYVLVHLLDSKMWAVLKQYIDDIKVTVWAHGAEIQLWKRREFEFENMSPAEVGKQKKLSDQRKKFWQEVLKLPHPNLKVVFVSEYFRREVFEDFSLSLPDEQVEIIHNYINERDFPYTPKLPEHRKRILSIRPFASRKYANDLTIKAILELSTKDFFNELEFCIVGDGILFDELTSKVSHFSNVVIRKEFLTQSEISKLHQYYGVFLSPTRMDSQGVSRDEAMSSGLVPITNKVAAIPEFLDDLSGFMVDPDDYLGLADAIEALYQNEELFLEMSANASSRVRKQCGLEATILKEIQLFSHER